MDVQAAVRAEVAQYIYRTIPVSSIAAWLAMLVMAYVYRGLTPPGAMAAWIGAYTLFLSYPIVLWWRYRGVQFTEPVVDRWFRLHMVGAFTASSLIGAGASFMLVETHVAHLYLFVLSMIVMAALALFCLAPHLKTLLAYIVPLNLITAGFLIAKQTPLYMGVGAVQIIALLLMLPLAHLANSVFLKSVTLRYQNKALIDELTVQKDAAEAANRGKSRFLAAASHDLRQPMHALNLYLGTISGLPLDERGQALVVDARKCAQAMDQMFGALLDVSSLDAGAIRPSVRAFAMDELLDRMRASFTPQADSKGVRLRVRRCSALVHSDPALVERILGNLVSNAMRYTESGRVLVGCRHRQGRLQVLVCDTGLGIAKDQQDLIFEEFYQVGNAERDRSRGLGLGLAIVHRIARVLDVPLQLWSQPGRGSVFSFTLPCVDGTQPVLAPAVQRKQGQLNGSFVAVIDDEELVRQSTRALLEQWQCNVITASSGADAIRQLAMQPPPDALICDFRLRGAETGVDVVTQLRDEFNHDIPALLVTGDTSPERLHQLQASGLPVLHKPLRDADLKDALLRLLQPAPQPQDHPTLVPQPQG